MHILEIPDQNIIDYLFRMQMGQIKATAIFDGFAKVQIGTDPGGFPIFSQAAQRTNWDMTKQIPPEGFKVTLSKPVQPGMGILSQFGSTRATLEIVNPSHSPYFATTQDGAIIDLATIEQGEITIEAQFFNLGARLPIFIGRIEGPPVESRGKTVFSLYDVTWENIRTPVLFENFAQITGKQSQDSYSSFGTLVNRSVFVPTAIDGFTAFGGNITFNEEGTGILVYDNNNPDQMDVRRIGIQKAAKPGLYRIEFQSPTNYTITYPDNEERQGSILTPFTFGSININDTDWTGADGSGVTITFQVFAPNQACGGR